MWILKSSKGDIFYLIPGEHVVGRKNCELVLGDDQSISRKHAVIVVSHPHNNRSDPSQKPVVEVFDTGSKYGTTLNSKNNDIKMTKDTKYTLHDGDEVHFGLQWNKWKLSFEPLVVLVSALPKAQRQLVKELVGNFGGHIVSEWHPQISHLTMASITLTVKAISALAYAKPIVSPEFWVSWKKAVESKTAPPNYEDYIPPLGETVLNKHEVSFLINPHRKTLFRRKTFFFFSERQFIDHGCLVEAAGGTCKLVSSSVRSKKQFVQPNSVVMQLLSMNSQSMSLSQAPEVFTDVATFVKAQGKRLIPASEIGLAVLHCSLEKYCNPDYNFSHVFSHRTTESLQPLAPGKILATETQSSDDVYLSGDCEGKRRVIPDSGTESKIGESQSTESVTSTLVATRTEEMLSHTLHPPPPVMPTISNTETQSLVDSQSQRFPHSTKSGRGAKRLRIVESDDEVEEVRPAKLQNAENLKAPVVVLDDSDDEPFPSKAFVSNSSSSSRLNISNFSNKKEDDDLFSDFKEYQPNLSHAKPIVQVKSDDMNADDLFADFKDDVQSNVHPVTVSKPKLIQSQLQFSKEPTSHTSQSTKRNLSPDKRNEPPEKRLARLKISKSSTMIDNLMKGDSDDDESDNVPFISCVDIKKDEDSLQSTSNTTVFKPLLVSRNNSSVTSTNSSVDISGCVNYKKFKKVNPLHNNVVPHIIGGSDLQPYRSLANQTVNIPDDSDHEDEDLKWANFFSPRNMKTMSRSRKL